ncbi:MAG: zinc ribbon domain-containing protein [Clostridia bacterium]|nr:zinc ribbon domain-containing protein [Clostridia bacterium]
MEKVSIAVGPPFLWLALLGGLVLLVLAFWQWGRRRGDPGSGRYLAWGVAAALVLLGVSLVLQAQAGLEISRLRTEAEAPARDLVAELAQRLQRGEDPAGLQGLISVRTEQQQVRDALQWLIVFDNPASPDSLILAAYPRTLVGCAAHKVTGTLLIPPLPQVAVTFQDGEGEASRGLLWSVPVGDSLLTIQALLRPVTTPALLAAREREAAAGQAARGFFLAYWLLLAAWVYLDARRRGDNALGWGLLTLLTNAVGWLVYLLSRGRLANCPACGLRLETTYLACPRCGTRLGTACRSCNRKLEDWWQYCPDCGTRREED